MISNQLSDAELDAVTGILANDTTCNGLLHVIGNAHMFAEAMTKKYRHPKSPPVVCKEGCYWCCYQAVQVTAPEALRIGEFIASEMDSKTRENVKEKLASLDNRTRGLSPSARAKLRAPCAFVQNGQCTIYAVRPLACAEFTSFDIQDCKRGQRIGFKPKSVIHDKAQMLVYYAVKDGLIKGLSTSLPNVDGAILELTAAVSCVLNTNNAAEEWLAGGKVFASAHLTG